MQMVLFSWAKLTTIFKKMALKFVPPFLVSAQCFRLTYLVVVRYAYPNVAQAHQTQQTFNEFIHWGHLLYISHLICPCHVLLILSHASLKLLSLYPYYFRQCPHYQNSCKWITLLLSFLVHFPSTHFLFQCQARYFLKCKYDHISPALKSQWLPAVFRIKSNIKINSSHTELYIQPFVHTILTCTPVILLLLLLLPETPCPPFFCQVSIHSSVTQPKSDVLVIFLDSSRFR